jgi:hypothetical protein
MNFSCDILRDAVNKRGLNMGLLYSKTGDDGLITCRLCNEAGLLEDTLQSHFASKHNVERGNLLRQDLREALNAVWVSCQLRSKPLCDEMAMLNQVNHDPWKDAVHAELFRLMVAPKASFVAEPRQVERPLKKLRMCLTSERLSLLSMAVWKGKCLRQMPVVSDYDAALEWMRSGWKACKASQYDSQAMNIVVAAVQPFLG